MERTKFSNYHPEDEMLLERGNQLYNQIPSLILCADIHLREDTPACFTGDFQQEQWNALAHIRSLQSQYGCPVVHSGDLFHHWKPSPWLLRMAMKYLPESFFTIYGQHDLPQHNWELREKSGIAALEEAGKLKVLEGCHYGQNPEDLKVGYSVYWEAEDTFQPLAMNGKILVWHHLTYITEPFPGATGGNAIHILNKYPQFDLILTGDNHQGFTVESKKRLLVNPGPMTRQTAAQIDFKPRVYLWYEDTNTVIPSYLPIQEGVISREHIEVKEERDARIDAFVSKLDGSWEAEMSFEENLEKARVANNIREEVMQIIYKAIG